MKKLLLFFLLVLPFVVNGQVINTIAGNVGDTGYVGDGGPATAAKFNWPTIVRFDHSGNMYIADWVNNVIRKINTSGIVSTVAGNGYGAGMVGVGGYTGDGGQATAAELNGPTDIAFDLAGNMYIIDNDNNVIRKVTTAGIITTIAGTGAFGYNGDNIQATAAELNFPLGIAIDTVGNIYFSDEGNARVRKIDASGIITTVAGTGTVGYNGDEIPATAAQIRRPCWLAFSPSGDLYIPDYEDHRLRKVNSVGLITTVAGNGMSGITGDGEQATAASIDGCASVIFDHSGNFLISNNISCCIRKVSASGIITTIIGTDTCGYSGDGGPATSAKVSIEAHCSAIDAAGNLYVADMENNRIRKVTYNTTALSLINKTPQNITIYPNPASEEVTIKEAPPGLPQGKEIESAEVVITNVMGQVSFGKLTMTGEALFSISSLPNGVYFVKVNGVYAGRFVKE